MFNMEDEDKISSILEDVDNVAKRKVAGTLVARQQARAVCHLLDKVRVFGGTTEGALIYYQDPNARSFHGTRFEVRFVYKIGSVRSFKK